MVGFPHSEILGSKLIRSSPRLIAAYYVLHRLHAPRHPLDALKALDRSHYQCPQRLVAGASYFASPSSGLDGQIKKPKFTWLCCLSPGVTGSDDTAGHLFTIWKIRAAPPSRGGAGQTCSRQSDVGDWWSQTGSNRRPHACKACALPTELWPRRRTKVGGPG